jgi:hypothetical protein
VLRIGGTVLRERPCESGLLLFERILLLFVVELYENLPGRDPVAEVGHDPAHFSISLRRNRHLVHGRKRADHVNGPPHRIEADDFDLDWLGRAVRTPGLGRVPLRATGANQRNSGRGGD